MWPAGGSEPLYWRRLNAADPIPNARLHRHILQAGALLLFAVCSMLVVGPLVLPATTPLMDRFFGVDVPLQYQRALVVLLGACGLVQAVLLVTFTPWSWWILVVTGVLGVVQGLVSVPAFFPTLVNILFVFYLFTLRPLYQPSRGSPEARSR
jgi:hypothetical protein